MVIFLLLYGLLLRIISTHQSFWMDEAAQARLSSLPMVSVHYASDFQPPFSYILTHIWMELGKGIGALFPHFANIWHAEWFLRIPSVFFGVGAIFMLYTIVRRLLPKHSALVAMTLLVTAPFHIYYSQELRMYSLLTFLITLSWWLLMKKRYGLYAFVIFLSIFTHYFAFLCIFSQFVYVLLQKKSIKKYTMSLAFGIAPFLLWLPTFLKQLETSRGLIQDWPGWSALSNTGFLKFPFLTLAKFTVGMTSPENKMLYGSAVGIVGGIFVAALVVIFYHLRKNKHDSSPTEKKNFLKAVQLFGCWFAIPLLAAWIGGIFIPASSPWRIQFVLPAFYAIIALGHYAAQNQTKRIRLSADALIAILIFMNMYFATSYLFDTKNHREDWRGAISYTNEVIRKTPNNEQIMIYSKFISSWVPVEWYTEDTRYYAGISTQRAISAQSLVEIPKIRRIGIITYLEDLSDPQRLVEKHLSSLGYKLESEKDFRGVGIIRFYRK